MKPALPLPSPQELKRKYPTTEIQKKFIEESRKKIINILNGTDPRLLLIISDLAPSMTVQQLTSMDSNLKNSPKSLRKIFI